MDQNEVELHDDEQDIVESKMDPDAGTEEMSMASVDKAEGQTKPAPARRGDKKNSEPKQKVKTAGPEKHSENYDFDADLDALVESEATLSEAFKEKASVIFEAAVSSKIAEEVDRLEEQYAVQLEEETDAIRADIVEKVDSYLNYVVENWMEENRLAVQSGLRTEVAENFMGKLKDLFVESYIDVPESKVDLVDELAEEVQSLEKQLNDVTADAIEMSEALVGYTRDAIIRENSYGLAETQVEKLSSLVENIDFDDAETFAKKVSTIKESYFKTSVSSDTLVEESEEGEETIAPSASMDRYLNAIRRTNKS